MKKLDKEYERTLLVYILLSISANFAWLGANLSAPWLLLSIALLGSGTLLTGKRLDMEVAMLRRKAAHK